MEKSENTVEIYAAIVKFQGDVPVIFKENMVKDKYGKDKYTYADMADIKNTIQPHMKKYELGIIQTMNYCDDYVHIITEIIHTSGQWIRSEISAQVSINIGYMSQIQAIGSVSTYLKRYALSSMLGLVTDQDRDGNVDQDAQRLLEAKKLEADQKKMLLKVSDSRARAKLLLDTIEDKEFVKTVTTYIKNNNSLETMESVLRRIKTKKTEEDKETKREDPPVDAVFGTDKF